VGAQLDMPLAATAALDVRYLYLAGGVFDGPTACSSCNSGCTTSGTSCQGGGCNWWGCWQDTSKPPGQYLRDLIGQTKAAGQIPMVTYYEILQTSGANDGPELVGQVKDAALMTRYFADFRFLLQTLGSTTAMMHVEPDFWGYAQYGGQGPHAIPAAVATANPTDCAGQEESVAGMGRCLISMVRKYAPNTFVGLHASAWSTQIDATENKDASLDVEAEAAKTAAFLVECGARDGDFVVVETSDRDAGYYQIVQGQDHWWDPLNQTLPHFHQAFRWAKALAEGIKRPNLWWQTPLGNSGLNNTTQHWKDNRVEYFFAHPDELVGAHSVGMLFGAGQGDQTNPGTDQGLMLNDAKTYTQGSGALVCP
jgi:hypothetical protein